MLGDSLRIILIILLIISILLLPILFVTEIFYDELFGGRSLSVALLAFTQMSLLVTLCASKQVKTLVLFLILNTVILVIVFTMDWIYLSNIVENSREKYYKLIRKYPLGDQPDEWSLLVFYLNIRESKCCYVDRNEQIPGVRLYFTVHHLRDCVLLRGQGPTVAHPHFGEPCILFAYSIHHAVTILIGMKILFVTAILIVFTLYIYARHGEVHRKGQPTIEPANNPTLPPYPNVAGQDKI